MTAPQPAIQSGGGADMAQLGEGLWEIPKMLTAGAELLGEETDVVCVPNHLFEVESRLFRLTGPRQTLDVPERAHVESALRTFKAIRRRVFDPVSVEPRYHPQALAPPPQAWIASGGLSAR